VAKRLRIFAGPNGSGKSTFIKYFPSAPNLKLGVYVNADDIEQEFKEKGIVDLSVFKCDFTTLQIREYFKSSSFSPAKLGLSDIWRHFSVNNNQLSIDSELTVNSYIAADLAEFIRQNLVRAGLSFSFETVMSDFKKIEFLRFAKSQDYKIYLYYFSTEDPSININRVAFRVAQSGHPVNSGIIESRYYRSLENLKDAVLISDRAYIFDNSGSASVLISEIEEGRKVHVIDQDQVPNWFIEYLVDKR